MSKKKVEKQDHKPLIIGILGIVILTGIIIAIAIFTKEDNSQYTYNNFPFERGNKQLDNGRYLWYAYAEKEGQPYQIPFYYHPSELEDIVSQPNAESLLLNAGPETQVFVTLDPSLKSRAVIAAVEISRITGSRYNILNLETHGALTREPDDNLADTQNPIVTCANANNESIVIGMILGPANIISEADGCIIIEGQTEEDLLRGADRFAYQILGVME